MSCSIRAAGAAGGLILVITCPAVALAQTTPTQSRPPSSATATRVTVKVDPNPGGSPTTVTVEVRGGADGEPTQVRVGTDASPAQPVHVMTEVSSVGRPYVSARDISVDINHPLSWQLQDIAGAQAGCGPHPPSGTPGCGTPLPMQAQAVPLQPSHAAPTAAPEVAGQQVERPTATGGGRGAPVLAYTVQRGDTLTHIAEQFYGDAAVAGRIAQANSGRTMADGTAFTEANRIRSGWVLALPQPTRLVQDQGGQRWYTVQRGDTLAGVAARLLGDERRWPELYQLNRGAGLPDGRTLTNPGVIWAGLRLQLPADGGQASAPTTGLAIDNSELPAVVGTGHRGVQTQ